MRIVFIGSKDIGYLCLKQLIEWKKNIVAVIARGDDPHQGQWYKSVSQLAEKNNLKLFKTNNINNLEFINEMKTLKPELAFTAQFPQIYKEDFIKIFPKGCINLHFAPLPKYRGCFPIPHAIINNEKEFGVTIHHINTGVDNGPIIAQTLFPIDITDTGKRLYEKSTNQGLELFKETFPLLEESTPKGTPQNEEKAIRYKREKPSGGIINWHKNVLDVYNFIRSLYFLPFEAANTTWKSKKICVTEVERTKIEGDGDPGRITKITKGKGFLVNTKDKQLLVKKIQIKRYDEANADEYLLQEGIKEGDLLK